MNHPPTHTFRLCRLSAGLPNAMLSLLMGAALWLGLPTFARADEAVIRKNITERLPNFPKIDEVTKTPIAGLFELRAGTEIFYADAKGDHLIRGSIIDTKDRKDLTEARIEKLTAIDFKQLPLKDSMVVKQGKGTRKIAVFADPNCGYCKQFERELTKLKDVTVYTFLYPVLGADSLAKSNDIWCTKDAMSTWRAWMLDGKAAPRTMGACDKAAVERNMAFGMKHRITGTPAVIFEDGKRVPGAMQAPQMESYLAEAEKAKSAKPAATKAKS
jgi:thiol:disulfide interchange protein DsbC